MQAPGFVRSALGKVMSSYRFDRLKILVVDDNQHMRRLVVAILQAFGVVQTQEALSGETAWPILRDSNPDVVFLDWQMNGMTGLDFARLVRTSPQSPNPFIPIIMLTGHTHVDHVRLARDAGVNEFLAKPVSVKGILTRLVSVIEHPRPFVRTKTYFGPCRRRRASEEYRGPERRATGETTALDDPPTTKNIRKVERTL
jgi:CheY-like chemotaxis protein